LKVDAEVSVTTGSDKAEDAAHVSADIGTYVLSVRQDTLAASTSTDGDYQSFKTDDVGSLWVHVSEAARPAVDNQLANDSVSVGNTEVAITAALASRRKMLVQNVDNSKPCYVGATGLSTADGLRLGPGAALEIELDAGATLYGITASGTVDVRVLELGYV
jgi:hypothetical protein